MQIDLHIVERGGISTLPFDIQPIAVSDSADVDPEIFGRELIDPFAAARTHPDVGIGKTRLEIGIRIERDAEGREVAVAIIVRNELRGHLTDRIAGDACGQIETGLLER